MIGVLFNTATVIIGSSIGLIFKKAISSKYSSAAMTAIGLCTLLIGISGMLKGQNTLVAIISMVLGAICGTLLNLDGKINQLGTFFEKRAKKEGDNVSLAEGFVTSGLLFCVGAMTIVGSLEAGINNDNTMLITKSILDLISSIMLASAMGIGVLISAVFVFVFQGALVLLSSLLAPVLNDAAVAEITCVGSLMIFALGLNLLKITKIKVANFLPTLIFAPLVTWAISEISAKFPALA